MVIGKYFGIKKKKFSRDLNREKEREKKSCILFSNMLMATKNDWKSKYWTIETMLSN